MAGVVMMAVAVVVVEWGSDGGGAGDGGDGGGGGGGCARAFEAGRGCSIMETLGRSRHFFHLLDLPIGTSNEVRVDVAGGGGKLVVVRW